jgi:hypothetical protein
MTTQHSRRRPTRFSLPAFLLPAGVFGLLLVAWPFNLPNAMAVYDPSLAVAISPSRQLWGYMTIAYYPHIYFGVLLIGFLLRREGAHVLAVLGVSLLPLLTAHAQFCLWMLTGVELISLAPG